MSFVLVLALLLGAACDESLQGPTARLDETFTLRPGESASIERVLMTVRFDEVTRDSRCPIDAVCIQAGSASVALTVTAAGRARRVVLESGGGAASRTAIDGITLTLTDVQPSRRASEPIAPADYRVSLRASRN